MKISKIQASANDAVYEGENGTENNKNKVKIEI